MVVQSHNKETIHTSTDHQENLVPLAESFFLDQRKLLKDLRPCACQELSSRLCSLRKHRFSWVHCTRAEARTHTSTHTHTLVTRLHTHIEKNTHTHIHTRLFSFQTRVAQTSSRTVASWSRRGSAATPTTGPFAVSPAPGTLPSTSDVRGCGRRET